MGTAVRGSEDRAGDPVRGAERSDPAGPCPTASRALGVMALPALLLTVLLVGYVVWQGGVATEAELRRALPYLIGANHSLVFVALLLVLRHEGRALQDIGWRRDRGSSILRAVLLGAAAGLSLYLFKELVLDAILALTAGNTPTFTTLFRFGYDREELPLLVVATTLVAVEESVYRGYGLAALAYRWGPGRAILAMAVLFGLLHWGNGALAAVFTGVLGVAFGGLYLWRRSLIVPLVAHVLYNALVILT